jgi:hypothetical protein
MVPARVSTILAIVVIAALGFGSGSPSAGAQQGEMKDDVEQFAMDLHVAVQRSSLSDQQKEQIRTDLKDLREARQNHDRIGGFRAMRNLRSLLDSDAFQPEDRQRIKQDLEKIREDREKPGGGM